MSNYIREYSPDKVSVTWGGKMPMSGFADGTFISMSRNSARTDVTVGAQGDSGITRSADYTGLVEVTLLQNSPTNQYLTYLMSVEDTSDELVRANMEVIDPSGAVLAIAARCHLQTPADIVLGDGQNAKTWTFFSEHLRYLTLPNGLLDSEAVQNAAQVYGAIKTVSDNLKTITS